MKLRQLFENLNRPQEFNFGKIKVSTKPDSTRMNPDGTSNQNLITTINSFKGHDFQGGRLGGVATYNRQNGWTTEFHGSVEDNMGRTVLLKGTGTGQTLELSIQQALKDFIQTSTSKLS